MGWFSRNKFRLSATGFFILSVILRFASATQTPHPTGWDGYYYVMQVHSWLTFGYLQSPDFSLIYPFFAVIAFFTNDFVLAYQVGVAILAGAVTITVFCLLKQRGTSYGWICLVCSYLLFSPLLTYFILQFPKNVLGLIFLMIFVEQLRRLVPNSVPQIVASLCLFIATVLTHRMTGGFALIIAALHALKYIPWRWTVVGGVVLLIISLLPGVIHFSDLVRFSNQFVLVPQLAPYSFYKIFSGLTMLFRIDLIIVTLIIVASLYFNLKNPNIYWMIVAIIGVFPFFYFSAGSAGHRFFLVAPLAFIMTIPFDRIRINYSIIPTTILVVASLFAFRSYRPRYFDPPNTIFFRVTSKLSTAYKPVDYPLVIAHQPLAEIIIFTTDFDALNWLPPEDIDPTHVLRLIHGVDYGSLRKYLEPSDLMLLQMFGSGYFALPEDAWHRFVNKAKQSSDTIVLEEIFNGENPMDLRPYYLNKGKR